MLWDVQTGRLLNNAGFVVDGLERLLRSPEFQAKRAAIEAQVREEHAAELAATADYWRRVAVEEQIDREVRRRLASVTPSPYSLWSCR
jgi:hypothetical protein